MKIKVEFGGGLELLFEGQKTVTVDDLAEGSNLRDLIENLRRHKLKEKEEMFV